jgi:hypothetical protein
VGPHTSVDTKILQETSLTAMAIFTLIRNVSRGILLLNMPKLKVPLYLSGHKIYIHKVTTNGH